MSTRQNWETVIGIEAHVHLTTRSKLFSGAANVFGAPPNAHACLIDVALPGVLPVANREAISCAIRFGLAVEGRIAHRSIFARKNYFYPDLPKGYQISQFEIPVIAGGHIDLPEGRRIRLTRAHLEEDAGKNVHDVLPGSSAIDLNRAGAAMLEIVSEPELFNVQEALSYARTLHALVRWLGISDGNMQEGSFRCDVNVSVRRKGEALGTRCELKNLNSFRFLELAARFESERQIQLLEDGGQVVQQTRLYDPEQNETRAMRSKEDSDDYRYFPDPDLPPLVIDEMWVAKEQKALPELPALLRVRFSKDYGLSEQDINTLTANRQRAEYFEAVHKALGHSPKICANWVLGEVLARMNREEFSTPPLSPQGLARILAPLTQGTLSGHNAKILFTLMWEKEVEDVDALMKEKGLTQVEDKGTLEKWVRQVLAAEPKSVAEYLAGKEKALNALVGKVMKLSQGRANPVDVAEVIKRLISQSHS